jgi:hypothetical protein
MDLHERIELWRSIDPDPDFCRRAERDMLALSSQDKNWIDARMGEFEAALHEKTSA